MGKATLMGSDSIDYSNKVDESFRVNESQYNTNYTTKSTSSVNKKSSTSDYSNRVDESFSVDESQKNNYSSPQYATTSTKVQYKVQYTNINGQPVNDNSPKINYEKSVDESQDNNIVSTEESQVDKSVNVINLDEYNEILATTIPEVTIDYEKMLSSGKLNIQTSTNISYTYTYNLQNIIPNPLYNDFINNNYDNDLYATGYYNGFENTAYLRKNKTNISNIISNDYYIPSIGELGIIMENIQTINDSISNLGESYKKYIIPEDSIIASSTLYSDNDINNEDYLDTNVNDVWSFDNKIAKIIPHRINENFIALPLYKYENNVIINLDDEFVDVEVNSIITIKENEIFNNYIELNPPIHKFDPNIKSDFNVDNWLSYPFSSKYLFYILFPEVSSFLETDNNFTYLHDQYLSYYIHNDTVEIPTYGFESNNGTSIAYNYNPWTQYLIYNIPVYSDHMVIMPTFGSGELDYNCEKGIASSVFYVALPTSCTDFECKMNNVSDCNIIINKYRQIKAFNIYSINLSFNVNTPTDNMITFKCTHENKKIIKNYFYSIYSLQLCCPEKNIKFSIDNFYVAKDPFYWWKINNWSSYEDSLGKLFDGDEKYLGNFKKISSTKFNYIYDMSYLINKISKNINIDEATCVTNRGLRVDRLLDNTVLTYTYLKTEENNTYYYCYNYYKHDNDNNYIECTLLEATHYLENNNYKELNLYKKDGNNSYIECKPSEATYYLDNGEYKDLTGLSFYKTNRTLDITIPSNYTIVSRVNRTVDEFGIYNDLIFVEPKINEIDNTTYNMVKLPIFGAKQTLYLRSNDTESNNINFCKFTDYLFLYNNTNTILSITISDPSLTMINKKNAIIHIQPYELRLYYPSNFIYNNINTKVNNNLNILYTIKIINSSVSVNTINFTKNLNGIGIENVAKLNYLLHNGKKYIKCEQGPEAIYYLYNNIDDNEYKKLTGLSFYKKDENGNWAGYELSEATHYLDNEYKKLTGLSFYKKDENGNWTSCEERLDATHLKENEDYKELTYLSFYKKDGQELIKCGLSDAQYYLEYKELTNLSFYKDNKPDYIYIDKQELSYTINTINTEIGINSIYYLYNNIDDNEYKKLTGLSFYKKDENGNWVGYELSEATHYLDNEYKELTGSDFYIKDENGNWTSCEERSDATHLKENEDYKELTYLSFYKLDSKEHVKCTLLEATYYLEYKDLTSLNFYKDNKTNYIYIDKQKFNDTINTINTEIGTNSIDINIYDHSDKNNLGHLVVLDLK